MVEFVGCSFIKYKDIIVNLKFFVSFELLSQECFGMFIVLIVDIILNEGYQIIYNWV